MKSTFTSLKPRTFSEILRDASNAGYKDTNVRNTCPICDANVKKLDAILSEEGLKESIYNLPWIRHNTMAVFEGSSTTKYKEVKMCTCGYTEATPWEDPEESTVLPDKYEVDEDVVTFVYEHKFYDFAIEDVKTREEFIKLWQKDKAKALEFIKSNAIYYNTDDAVED